MFVSLETLMLPVRSHHEVRVHSVAQTDNLRKIIIALAALAFVMFLAQLALSNWLATYGSQVSKTHASIVSLEQSNRDLEKEVAELGSLANITTKSRQAGLVETPNTSFLTPLPLASLK